MAYHGRYAPTKAVAALKLGIRYGTFLDYSKQPDFPKPRAGAARYDLEAIKRWIEQRKSAHNFGVNGSSGYKPSEREQSIIDKNRIAAEREQFRLDIDRGRYELKSVTGERIEKGFGLLVRELTKAFRHELPPQLEGLTAGEIAKLNNKKLQHIFGQVQAALR